MTNKSTRVIFDDRDGVPTMRDITPEEEQVNYYVELEAQIQSDYQTYCEHCEGKPLSYDIWLHTDVSDDNKYDELPF